MPIILKHATCMFNQVVRLMIPIMSLVLYPVTSGDKWNERIGQNTDEAFEADDSTFEDCLDQDVADFARALNLRGEISKISSSLGSTTMTDTTSDDLFELDNPFLSTLDEMEIDFSKDIKAPKNIG